jgi:beta-galactosidase GanA
MQVKTLLAATAALALMSGGAALAQVKSDGTAQPGSATGDWNGAHAPSDNKQYSTQTTVTTTTPPAETSATTTTTDTTATTDTTTTTATATSATSSGTAASFTTQMVTNGPVPDTAENRAKYGQPMSRAGKRTAARGN